MSENRNCLPSSPLIAVLMINYKQWGLTEKCINSLRKSIGVDLIISLVDNSTSSSVPEWVTEADDIVFYSSPVNSGFIGGCIHAFEMAMERKPDLVMLLNNDTEVEPDTLKLLADRFRSDPSTGLVTPAITYASNKNLIWHAGGKFIPWQMKAAPVYRTVSELPVDPVEVDQVSGCGMMMRPELFRETGYQNPEFFLYHEDVEKSLRAKAKGLHNWLVPQARLIHHVSVSAGGVLSKIAVYFTHRNRFIFAKRNLKPGYMFLFTLYYLSVTAAKTLTYPLKGTGNLVPVMWLATLHGVTGTTNRVPEWLFNGQS